MMLRIVSFKHQKGSIKMKYVSTEKAPAAIGPYSQGIIAGDFLYASGQIPINPENGKIEAKTIEEQADQAIRFIFINSDGFGITMPIISV